MRRVVGIFLSAALASAGAGATVARADPAPERHCRVMVLGQQPTGEYVMSGVTCIEAPVASGGVETLDGWIATHYDGPRYTGESLGVQGSGCNGGWWNLPAEWNDWIESTWSPCTVRHYVNANLGTPYDTTYDPGGDLDNYPNAASSVRYLA